MMHGLGLGVPQSYAQAGRWTIAMRDLADLQSGRAGSAPKSPLDIDEAAAYGVIGTLAAVLRDRMLYPRSVLRPAISGVEVTVKISIGPQGLRHDLVSARSGTEGSTAELLNRSTYLDAVAETLEAAVRELPRYDLPRREYQVTVPYGFKLKAL